eukprot:1140377-Pelagomonas_calceolata.AAC.12
MRVNRKKIRLCNTAKCEASKQHHHDLCGVLSRVSSQVTLHTSLFGVGEVIYIPDTLEPLKDLGIDPHTLIKLALKLHARSVHYAHKLASTRRAYEKTPLNCHQRHQVKLNKVNNVPGAGILVGSMWEG